MPKVNVDEEFKSYIEKRLVRVNGGLLKFTPECGSISQEEVIQMVEILKSLPKGVHPPKEIIFIAHNLGDSAAAALATLDIQSLCVSGSNIGPKGAESLANNTSFETLDLSYNPIGDEGAIALSRNKNIQSLNVGNCEITASGTQALLSSHTLRELDLSGNGVSDDDIPEFIPGNIKVLNLSNNFLKVRSAQRLAKSAHIERLDLSDNEVGNKGAISFQDNKALKELCLEDNELDDECVVALSNMKGAAENLGLAYNNFSGQAQDLLFLASRQKKRKMIDLSDNGTKEEVCARPSLQDLILNP